MSEPTITTQVRIPASLYDWLRAEAFRRSTAERRVSIAEIVRELVQLARERCED